MPPDRRRNMSLWDERSTGLLDNYDHHWEEVWFGTNENYGNGEIVLLVVRGPAYQDGEIVQEELQTFYNLGNKDRWKIAKGGDEADLVSGAPYKDSGFVRLIDAAFELGEDVQKMIRDRGEPNQADTWRGLKWHIERKDFPWKNRRTGEEGITEVPLPTAFLGTIDDEEEPKKKAAPKGRAKGRTGGRKKPLRKAVVEFASEFEDHADFIDAVFDADEFDRADELQDDEELSNEVLDPDGDLWAEAGE